MVEGERGGEGGRARRSRECVCLCCGEGERKVKVEGEAFSVRKYFGSRLPRQTLL